MLEVFLPEQNGAAVVKAGSSRNGAPQRKLAGQKAPGQPRAIVHAGKVERCARAALRPAVNQKGMCRRVHGFF